jgi:hypothetical protein
MTGQSKADIVDQFKDLMTKINGEKSTSSPIDGFYIRASSGPRFVLWDDISTDHLLAVKKLGFTAELGDWLHAEITPIDQDGQKIDRKVLFLDPEAWQVFNLSKEGDPLRHEHARRHKDPSAEGQFHGRGLGGRRRERD